MRFKPAQLFLPVTAAITLTLCAAPSGATTPAEDDEVARLNAAGHALKSNILLGGKTYGHAVSMINAPLATVRKEVTSYGQYKTLAPEKFSNVRVIAKEGPTTDVYMQVPIMHGLVNLWQVLKFGAPQQIAPGVERLEGKFVKGNVKDANIVFTMRALDENFTVLTCDLLLVPSVPAPQAAIDEELRDSALTAVDALHTRAQGGVARTLAFNVPAAAK